MSRTKTFGSTTQWETSQAGRFLRGREVMTENDASRYGNGKGTIGKELIIF